MNIVDETKQKLEAILNEQNQPINTSIDPFPEDQIIVGDYHFGIEILKTGKVAVLTMAAGHGTRLGSDLPKGIYRIKVDNNEITCFEIQAKRLCNLKEFVGKNIPITWFIACSEKTYQQTVNYFTENNFFGFPANDILIFKQPELPCFLTSNLKVAYESFNKIYFSPSGNADILNALIELDKEPRNWIETRHLQHLIVVGIDNVLCRPADPAFLGCMIKINATVGLKVSKVKTIDQKVGVLGIKDGKAAVIEYSEKKNLVNLDKLNLANIAYHYIKLDFLKVNADIISRDLKYHMNIKSIKAFCPETGKIIDADVYKLERFIFDILSFSNANEVFCQLIDDDNEFCPLKSKDDLSSCSNAIKLYLNKIISMS